MNLFEQLDKSTRRPRPYEFYTARTLWTDEHVSEKMLEFHLDEAVDLASRNHAFIDSSAAWIIERFEIGSEASVCDFGCGPGLYTERFAEAGAEVTGIDFSENSVEYARKTASKNGLEIDYVLQDYLEFSTDKKFDLITMIFCDFCALSPSQRKTLLGKFRGLLKEGGSVLLDVLTMKHFESTEEKPTIEHAPEGGFWVAAPYYLLSSTYKYADENLILGKHTIIEKDRTREIYNWLQCFRKETLEAEFHESGLKITEFFSDVGGDPLTSDSTQMAVIAHRI
jgi:SAM-dependent methyltransferase